MFLFFFGCSRLENSRKTEQVLKETQVFSLKNKKNTRNTHFQRSHARNEERKEILEKSMEMLECDKTITNGMARMNEENLC
jgi:hypothetical protein